MSSAYLNYQGLQLAVSADCEADLIWLQDFLGPSYRPMDGFADGPIHRVGLHGDPNWAHWIAEWERHGHRQHVLAHVLDGKDLQLPCLQQDDGSLLAWDDLFGCFYRRDPAGVTSVLRSVGPPLPRRPRLALMRAVREFALHHELRQGALALHASGLVRDGKAILFAGPRKAGKTTLLSACLSQVPDLKLLANDRVMLSPGQTGWSCRGMATAVSVRPGDEDLLPGLRQQLHRHTLGPEVGPDEPMAREFPLQGRLMLSPSQYCRGLGVTMAAESQTAFILLPRVDPTVHGLRWRRLDSKAAASLLAGALFGTTHPFSRSELFDTPESGLFPRPTDRFELVHQLSREVPCGELVIGSEAYRCESLQSLLDQILAG